MSATAEQLNSDKPHIPASALELAKEAENELTAAKTYQVRNNGEYEAAGLDLKRIKEKIRMLDDQRKAITRPIDAAKKGVMDFFRKPESFLKDAESILKRAMLAYQSEQERIRREEEANLREAQRIEQERLAKEAEELEKAGDAEAANAVIEQAASMPEVIVNRAAPAVQGVKTQTRWGALVTNKMELIKAVAEGKVPDIALDVNMKFLNQQAVSLKDALNIPGVKAEGKKQLAA